MQEARGSGPDEEGQRSAEAPLSEGRIPAGAPPAEELAGLSAVEPPGSREESSSDQQGPEEVGPTRLEDQLAELHTLFEASIASSHQRDEEFRRLYDDLEHFKGQAVVREMRPLYHDLLLVIDRIERDLARFEGDALAFIESIHAELTEALARRGVEQVNSQPGELFDATTQRVLSAEPTGDQAATNRIARVVRQGYRLEATILRPAEVVVWRATVNA